MAQLFGTGAEASKVLKDWWSGLDNDRASRAELRRCKEVTGVYFVPAFHRLIGALSPHMREQQSWKERVALIVQILAHVKRDDHSLPVAKQMSQKRGNHNAISQVRFRRLLEDTREELPSSLIRVIGILDGAINIADLAESVYFWGDSVKRKWCFDYYEVSQ